MGRVAKFTALVLVAVVPAGLAAFSRIAHAEHREQVALEESSIVPRPAAVTPASAADLKGVADALDRLRESQRIELQNLDRRVSRIEGYMEAEAERKHGGR